jgi:biofilm PGA synthesis lipoprotein PgaB
VFNQRSRLFFFMLLFAIFFIIGGCFQGSQEVSADVQGVAVLMYHHLGPVEGPATITPERFSSHLDMLIDRGFHVIPIKDLGSFLEGKKKLPGRSVVITFDDGYESFYTHAYSELKKRNLSATNFIIVKKVGDGEPNGIPKLSWEQMQEMQRGGMSFYSHTYDAHDYLVVNKDGGMAPSLVKRAYIESEMRYETRDEFKKRVSQDLQKAKEILELKLRQPVPYLAAPYGWIGNEAFAVAREAGYNYIFGVNPGIINRKSPLTMLPRIDAGNPGITASKLYEILDGYFLKIQSKAGG